MKGELPYRLKNGGDNHEGGSVVGLGYLDILGICGR